MSAVLAATLRKASIESPQASLMAHWRRPAVAQVPLRIRLHGITGILAQRKQASTDGMPVSVEIVKSALDIAMSTSHANQSHWLWAGLAQRKII